MTRRDDGAGNAPDGAIWLGATEHRWRSGESQMALTTPGTRSGAGDSRLFAML